MDLKREYRKMQEEQLALLSKYPYEKVTYYVYDEDEDCIIDIMRVSEIDNTYKDMDEIISLLNKQRNIIQGLKTTKKRMRNDVRKYSRLYSKLQFKVKWHYECLKREFEL